MIVQMVIEGLLDVAEDCKDRRAFWALVGSAVTLLAANISFIAMISEAFSGRVLTALVALAASSTF